MRSRALAALCLGLVVGPPALAAITAPPALAQYREREQRLQDIGWQLVRGNAPYCAETGRSIGLTLQDMAGFGSPDAVRTALGLDGDFAVQSAAAGSPSARAGLSANLEVGSIAGTDPNRWPADRRRDWRRLARAYDLIDAELAKNGAVELAVFGAQFSARIPGELVCATRFELSSDSKDAKAEGARVIIGEEFVGFDYPDEELAAAIAHELAHNFLRHRAWLDANGRKRKGIRLTEREADRLMPWLLANAGYDPRAAARFMERWGPGHDRGIFRARTHDGWDERLEAISGEVALVEAQMRESGVADWKQRFRREIVD